MHCRTIQLRLTAAAMVMLLSACSSDTATSPAAAKLLSPKFALTGGLYVFNSQLSPIVSGVTAFGHVQVKFPNDPIRNVIPSPPPISVAIEGIIFNPDLNSLGTESGIYYSPGGLGDTFATLVAPLGVTLPPSPIRNYNLDATVSISHELATQLVTSSSYTIRIGSLEGRLVPGGPPI